MSNVGYATLTIIPSAKGFESALRSETSGKIGAQGKTGGKEWGGAFIGGLKPMLGVMGGLFAAEKIGGFFKGAITQASDLGESVNALNVVYGSAADGIIKIGQSAAQSLGLSNVEFNNLAVQFSGFAKGIAGPGGDVVGVIDDLTTRAADFASVMNLDVAEAAQLFQSGLAGETEPLRKFGIDLSAAAVEAHAYASGIAESGTELTEAQKVQARYSLLMKETAQTQGDFANTSDSLANTQRRLGASWDDFTGKIGNAFLPVVTSAFGFLADTALPTLSRLTEGIGGVWAILSEGDFKGAAATFGLQEDSAAVDWLFRIRDAITGFLPTLQTLGGAFATAFSGLGPALAGVLPSLTPFGLIFQALQPVLPQIAALFGQLAVTVGAQLAVALNAIAPLIQTVVNALSSTFVAIMPVVVQLVTTLAGAFTQLMPVVAGVIAQIAPLVATLVSQLVPVVTNLVSSVLPPVITVFGQLIAAVAPFIAQIAGALVPVIQNLMPVVTTVFNVIANVIRSAMQIVQGIIQTVTGIISGNWSQVWQGIQNITSGVWNTIRALVSGAIQVVLSIIQSVLATISSIWSAGWNRLRGFVSDAWNNITSAISDGVNRAVSFISELPGRALSALGNLGSTLLNSGRSLIQGFIDGITSIDVGGAISGVLSKIRDFFPFSPAKRGPFSGRGYTTYSGRALASDFAKGIEAEERAVTDAALGLANAAQIVPHAQSFRSPDVTGNRLDRTAGGALSPLVGSLTLQSTGDTREDLEEALFHLRRIGRGGAHAK